MCFATVCGCCLTKQKRNVMGKQERESPCCTLLPFDSTHTLRFVVKLTAVKKVIQRKRRSVRQPRTVGWKLHLNLMQRLRLRHSRTRPSVRREATSLDITFKDVCFQWHATNKLPLPPSLHLRQVLPLAASCRPQSAASQPVSQPDSRPVSLSVS